MKLSTRYAIFVIAAAVLFAAALTLFSAPSGAQDDGWTIMRAEYGTRAQHKKDVTDIVKDLVGRGGVNGRVAVNNQTMGGDPAVGAEKHLRIWARNRKYEEREFEYKEGGFVDAVMFAVRRDRDDCQPPHSHVPENVGRRAPLRLCLATSENDVVRDDKSGKGGIRTLEGALHPLPA